MHAGVHMQTHARLNVTLIQNRLLYLLDQPFAIDTDVINKRGKGSWSCHLN